MFPPDLLQELVSLLAPDTAAFLTVFSPLVQHCQQEAASTKLVSPKFQSLLLSLPKLMDVKTTRPARGLAQWQWPTSWSHPTTGLLTQAGQAGWRAEVVSLSFLGLFLFSTFFLVGDPAVADQFLKGETRTPSWSPP